MKTQFLKFKVYTKIILKSEHKHQPLDYFAERISSRNTQIEFCEKQIYDSLKKFIGENYILESVNVNLMFDGVKMTVSGIVNMKLEGQRNIESEPEEYMQIISNLIKKGLNEEFNNSFADTNSYYQITEVNYPQHKYEISEDEPKSIFSIVGDKVRISIIPALVFITILNLIFIIGGSFYNTFQITSMQDRYNEANKILNETKTAYLEKLNEANKLKLQTDAEIDAILRNIRLKLFSDSSQIRQNLIKYNSNMQVIGTRIDSIKAKAALYEKDLENLKGNLTDQNKRIDKIIDEKENELQKKVKAVQADIKALNLQVANLQQVVPKFSSITIFKYMKLDLIFITGGLFLILIVILYKGIKPLINKGFSKYKNKK